jgi:hypothetical protein
MAVRNAAQFINFNPKYFLEEWSTGGSGYNLDNNYKRLAGYEPKPEQYARALGFLRGVACKSNYCMLRRLVFPTPPIMDPDCKTYFIDYENIPQCPKEDAGKQEKYRKMIRDFIFEVIGFGHSYMEVL